MGCRHCGFTNPPGMNFCGRCGASLTAPLATEPSLSGYGQPEGERRHVTVLFADMQGYTPLAETLGEEAVYRLMEQVYKRLITAVHAEEGTVQELTGDGVLALFGAPVALEDAPLRACRAALAMQQQLEAIGVETEATYGVRPQLRVGIHTGPVVVGRVGTDLRMEFKAIGDTVNLAARLQALAEPGTVLLSAATYALVAPYVEALDLGWQAIKGKAVPQRVYRLGSVKAGAYGFEAALRRGLSPLIGREAELACLEEACAASRQGTLRVVHLVGEAGVGKSRLLYELQRRLAGSDSVCLVGHCTAHGRSTSFLPFIEVVRALFGLAAGADAAAVRAKLTQGLERLGLSPSMALPFLLVLLGVEESEAALRGLDGEIIGARTRELLLALVQCHARLAPTVLILEDLHWSDGASQELLEKLVAQDSGLRLAVLCSSRPTYVPPWPPQPHVTTLPLAPLSPESTRHLVQAQLGEGLLPAETLCRLVDKAEGNPLFAEELARYLREAGDGNRAALPEEIPIPESLQDLLQARLDRLSPPARRLLQVAAVIGRRFPLALASQVVVEEGDFAATLQELEAHALVYPEGDGQTYRFKHALVQDAVYATLLSARRAELHQQVAMAIETVYAGRLGEWTESLAHHWSQTARRDKTVHYLLRSGEKSLRVYALEAAASAFRQVLAHADATPEGVAETAWADALLGLVRVHYYESDFKGMIALLERYADRVAALADLRRGALLRFWLGYAYAFAARRDLAQPLLEQALALGERLQDEECIGYACLGLLYLHAFWTPLDTATSGMVHRLGARILALAERRDDVYLASKCLVGLALHATFRGHFAQALAYGEQTLDLGRRAGDPRTRAMGLWAQAWALVFEERFAEALAKAEEAARLSPHPVDRLAARGAQGAALALMGQSQEGLALLAEVRRQLAAGEQMFLATGVDVPYGAAQVLAGHWRAGVRWIHEAMQRSAAWGNTTQAMLGHLILGEIYLRMALRQERPPLAVLWRNLGFALRTLPVAARLARHHLEEAVRQGRTLDMPGHLARALFDLGMLFQARRQPQAAAAYLHEAMALAEALPLPHLKEKGDRLLFAHAPKK
ncbi:MAG: hypothetical protein KatS3mg131_3449 [Candidatus Tectimicrobiota bacterium]|nr:MAG: hypothetical protein KatS3mg131_3449 [Candidatus Tectomicrobia bacterium]